MVNTDLLSVVKLSLARTPPEIDAFQVIDEAAFDVFQQLCVDLFLQRDRVLFNHKLTYYHS